MLPVLLHRVGNASQLLTALDGLLEVDPRAARDAFGRSRRGGGDRRRDRLAPRSPRVGVGGAPPARPARARRTRPARRVRARVPAPRRPRPRCTRARAPGSRAGRRRRLAAPVGSRLAPLSRRARAGSARGARVDDRRVRGRLEPRVCRTAERRRRSLRALGREELAPARFIVEDAGCALRLPRAWLRSAP
jgi:hypothetical protein